MFKLNSDTCRYVLRVYTLYVFNHTYVKSGIKKCNYIQRPLVETQLNICLQRHRVTGSSTLHVFVCESIDDNDYNSKQSSLLSSSLLLFKCLSVCASIKCLVALTLQCAVLTGCTCEQHIIDMWLAVRRRGTAKKSTQEPKYGKRGSFKGANIGNFRLVLCVCVCA
uniref:Uncharacterized protein n=1 Tax=Glossina palpalis gambiensis TaxID=67801 RepID=A0A1B0B1E5_9MUSC